MASISGILGTKRPTLQQKIPFITQSIHYSQFEDNTMQFYDCGQDVVERTADNIEMAGEIQAPVIARRIDADRYEIISGHKRVAAVKLLVETREMKKFSFIPTRIVEVDDDMAEYLLISTNDYPEKSDYERMIEVVRLYEIIPKLEEKKKKDIGDTSEKPAITARMLRRLVARETSMCATRVGNFKNIYTHFTPMAMDAFKNQQFGINVAIKLASLSEKEQNMLVKAGNLSIASINDFIECKKAKEALESKQSFQEDIHFSSYCIENGEQEDEMDDGIKDEEKSIPAVQETKNQPYYNKVDNTAELDTVFGAEGNEFAENADKSATTDRDLLQTAMNLKKKSEKIIISDADDGVKLEARIITEALSLWINRYEQS